MAETKAAPKKRPSRAKKRDLRNEARKLRDDIEGLRVDALQAQDKELAHALKEARTKLRLDEMEPNAVRS